jgi:tRNA A-37 threonylcarbamoyl transferase component Bud32
MPSTDAHALPTAAAGPSPVAAPGIVPAAPAAAGAGRRVGGRYTLRDVLGSGGMGTVWRAHDELLNRPVAVKELYPPARVSPEEQALLRERSLREARAAARISHPSAVTVYDVVEQDERPWIVMELLEARSLAQVLRSDGALGVEAAARVGLAVLGGLEAAHAAGVVHRDVKPANVLLADDGRIVLTDFGVATLDGDASTTITGLVLGSPAYMAPERAKGIPPSPAMDLWGLGATLFAAVEGRGPFHRQDALTTLHAVLTEPVPTAHRAGLLRPVLEGLLERDPDARLDVPAVRMLLGEVLRQQEAARTASRSAIGASAGSPANLTLDVTELDTAAMSVAAPRAPISETPVTPAAEERPPSAPSGTPRLGGQRTWARHAVAAVGAGALLPLALLGGAWAYGSEDDGGRRAGVTAAATPAAQASVTAAAGHPPATSTAPPSRLYRDTSGFTVAVPAGWRAEPVEGGVYLRDPGTRRFVAVRELGRLAPDLRSALAGQEKSLADRLPGYRRLGPHRVEGGGDVGEWDFTWLPYDGGPLRVRTRTVRTSATSAVSLYVSAPAGGWSGDQETFRRVVASFRPPASAAS